MPPKKLTKSTKSTKPSKPSKSSKSSESSKPSKPSKPSEPSSLEVVSGYDLRKVHIPYIGKDGTSSYQSRSAPKKAAILRESLLTLAKQKQQQRQQVGRQPRSAGPTTLGPLTSSRSKQRLPLNKLQKIQTISQNASRGTNQQRVEAYQRLIMEEEGEGEDRDEGEDEDNDNENERRIEDSGERNKKKSAGLAEKNEKKSENGEERQTIEFGSKDLKKR
ncbi:MAG: hypothetical protein M1840_003358 [Geoglossum simile]|nr:MAG: hypothetical protein M1840_003358 [Geoglossum simile]